MAEVVLQDNETIESLLKRFNRRVRMEGIISEARHREYYEKTSVKRKKKEAAKRRKSLRTTAMG
ncbi:MAG: 30S ribosomal protein S21 [Dehalococcoidia bacterium]|nr:30S ribosomal protein S21 [Dehalococcoidia bacterium]